MSKTNERNKSRAMQTLAKTNLMRETRRHEDATDESVVDQYPKLIKAESSKVKKMAKLMKDAQKLYDEVGKSVQDATGIHLLEADFKSEMEKQAGVKLILAKGF